MIYIYISDTGGGDKGRGWCIARRVWLVGCPLSGWRGGRANPPFANPKATGIIIIIIGV